MSAPLYSSEYVDGAAEVIRRFLLPGVAALPSAQAHEVEPFFETIKGHPMAKAALQTALLDAQLRAAGTSFGSYFGAVRETVPAGVSVGIMNSVPELLDTVAGYLDAGYLRIKLKIETVEGLLAEHGCPGCAVGIAHGDETHLAAYGLARTDPATAFRVDTRIPVASMSKPFTATAVLALVEAGRVELDAPVRTYLPDFRVADEAASAGVTVRHLLRHAVGWIGDMPEDGDRGDGALAAQVAALRDAPQVLPPGAAFSYANSGFVVAGRIVEVVTGEIYEEHVRRTVLEPLGLTASTFFAERAISAPAASGHKTGADGTQVPVQDPWLLPRCANPAGGLISTVADQLAWLRWWIEHDDRGPLTAAARRRMFTDLVPVGVGPASAGLGWHVVHHDGADVVYHDGRLSGSASVGLFVPQARFAAVVLTNADAGEPLHRALTAELLTAYAGIRPHDPQLQPDLDAATAAELAGSYVVPHTAGPDERISVRPQDAELVIRLESEQDTALYPDGLRLGRENGDLFRIRNGIWQGLPAEFLRTDGGALLGLRVGGRVFRRADPPE